MHQEITYIYISFIVVYFAQLHSLLCSHFIHELVQEYNIEGISVMQVSQTIKVKEQRALQSRM